MNIVLKSEFILSINILYIFGGTLSLFGSASIRTEQHFSRAPKTVLE